MNDIWSLKFIHVCRFKVKSWTKKFIEFNSFLFLDVSPNETNNIKFCKIGILELNKLLKRKTLY